MRIATVATGGVGGFLAVRLARIGLEVACIARGTQLEAIRKRGLRLESRDGSEMVIPWRSTADPATIGPVDVVIFAVKAGALDEAAPLCRPLLGPDTVVVPFLNGVEASDRLAEVLPPENVADGVAYVSTTIREPGVVVQTGDFARFHFGERDNRASPRLALLRGTLREAGIEAPETANVAREVWTKFVFFAALSGVTAAARCTLGEVRAHPETTALFRAAMEEVAMLGRALGVSLDPGVVERQWQLAATAPDTLRASTAIDLAAGRPLETPWINGAVVRLSRAAGIEAPVNRTLAALLAPAIAGRAAVAAPVLQDEKKRVSST